MVKYFVLLVAGMPLFFAAGSTSDPFVDTLLKGGPFAVVLSLIVMDKIGTNGERNRLRDENKEMREEIRGLNETMRSDIIPPLTEVARGLPEFTRTINQVTSALERLERLERGR